MKTGRPGRGAILAFGVMLGVAPGASAADTDRDGLRDGFERRHGVTDPMEPDSDGDGLVDAAEDLDGDLLSNHGEHRFGTDPGVRDTDGDGIHDGLEDADGDGRSNAREQDRYPVPPRLAPSLDQAPLAWPRARETCQTGHGKSRIRPCAFGDRDSDTLVVLFGDSHATQWQPALARAGRREGWRVVMITKTACPSVDYMPTGQQELDGGRSCAAWRTRALRWIQARRPEAVVMSNLRHDGASHLSWRSSYVRTLSALPGRTRGVVLADTPRMEVVPPACLKKHVLNVAACVTSRAEALRRTHDATEQDAAKATGDAFISLSWKVCPYDPCPVIIGRMLLWRDDAHITAAFARQLAPSMGAKLVQVLDGSAFTEAPTPRIAKVARRVARTMRFRIENGPPADTHVLGSGNAGILESGVRDVLADRTASVVPPGRG